MNERITNCQAQMPISILSAWYDHRFEQAEDMRVQEHIATCAACQSYVHMFQSTSHFIQTDNPPDIQESIWRGIQKGKQSSPAQKRSFVPIAAISAITLVAVVFVAVFVFLSREQGKQPPITVATGTINPTLPPTAMPTVNALHPNPSQGWVKVPALSFGKYIAFSQSEPLTGYVCGEAITNSSVTAPLLITVTHDGGRTWSTPITTPLHNQGCFIFTNPSNPQDIFLEGYDFSNNLINQGYYRSLDGGITWAKITAPIGNQGDSSNWLGIPIWTSTAMFVSAQGKPHILAVSLNNGPLQWADTNAPFIGAGHYAFGGYYSVGNTLYVINTPDKKPVTISKTSDNGASWSTFTPQGLSGGAAYPTVAADGHTLFVATGQFLATSLDDGRTWTDLPAFPSNYSVFASYENSGVTSTPDGTTYVDLYIINSSDNPEGALYSIAPGATSWHPYSGIDWESIIAISSDSKGHGVAAWNTLPTNFRYGNVGIEYRGI